jgi:thiamine-phosphate pyrophosphorylase
MDLVVISPEATRGDEHALVGEFFERGLARYHLRKPAASREALVAWLERLPTAWRSRIVLHQHHELAAEFGLGGVHEKDSGVPCTRRVPRGRRFVSRACHDLVSLKAALGAYDAVLFSPVFTSVSKPGYLPSVAHADLTNVLRHRTPRQRGTRVLALGGITAGTISAAVSLGFDGVAVLGAIWGARNPLAAFSELQAARSCEATVAVI